MQIKYTGAPSEAHGHALPRQQHNVNIQYIKCTIPEAVNTLHVVQEKKKRLTGVTAPLTPSNIFSFPIMPVADQPES